MPAARANLNNGASFTITEVSEEEERDSEASEVVPTVFENSVFVERDTLGSRIYEFNPLYISDAISDADPSEVRDLSLTRDQGWRGASTHGDSDNVKKNVNASDSGSNNVCGEHEINCSSGELTKSNLKKPVTVAHANRSDHRLLPFG